MSLKFKARCTLSTKTRKDNETKQDDDYFAKYSDIDNTHHFPDLSWASRGKWAFLFSSSTSTEYVLLNASCSNDQQNTENLHPNSAETDWLRAKNAHHVEQNSGEKWIIILFLISKYHR